MSLVQAMANVAGVCGVPVVAMTGRGRGNPRVVLARQVAMYLGVVVLEHRQHDVAGAFGRRRSVVGHNVRVIEDRRDDPAFDAWLAELERQLVPEEEPSP